MPATALFINIRRVPRSFFFLPAWVNVLTYVGTLPTN